MKFLLTAAPSALAVILSGCGGTPKTTLAPTPGPTEVPETPVPPTPAPEAPVVPATSVKMAWDNHFTQFGASNDVKIMEDYDDLSVVAVYNDACTLVADKHLVATYTGKAEIQGMFQALFTTLGDDANLVVPPFTGGDENPICEPAALTTIPESSNVFLVWSATNKGITHATDTFTWKAGYKVKYQTIVVTEAGATCSPAVDPVAPADTVITTSWNNHFGAFGAKDVTQILVDYTAESIIRIWDNTGSVYSKHTGLAEIETMFTALFKAITDADAGGTDSVKAPLVSVTPQYNSVFLVWESLSHPKATDTFIFNDAGKIIRQNIVVTSKVGMVAMV